MNLLKDIEKRNLEFKRDKSISKLQLTNDKFNLPKKLLKSTLEYFLEIKRLKLKINLNKYKLENKFLFKLSGLISKYYNKKVEFNIVNLKSLANNNDIFTELLTRKVKIEKTNPLF